MKYTYQGKGISGLRDLLPNFAAHDLKVMFRKMLRIRMIEEAIADRYHEDQMKSPIHLCIGQEAISVGCCELLRVQDKVFCGHRTHGPYLAKGGNLNAMLSELHCRKNGCAASRGGSMHLIDKEVGMEGSSAIVAGILPIATGAALATKQQGLDEVIAVFFGDAAVEEGAAWESFNFAKLKNLPILYICENNYYSVCSPIAYRQPPETSIAKKAEAFGLSSQSVDGTNVLAVHQATDEALTSIKQGNGPAFIEAHAYRWRGHHGSSEDSQLGYRTAEELDSWKKVDPLHLLLELDLLSEHEISVIQAEINEEIEAGFTHALQSPLPDETDLLTHVYAGEC
ncbi:thiamine pyrophosphate-dependent dehydrogenase E1 component subunit alpha [Simkania sp.]|uniref:thiamine pyrophosphate-dependent dehydrogenase E1 component subunit alpha n=1 Tax=Simkania sp. TaxID=34094 RepID=UPI003B51DBE6